MFNFRTVYIVLFLFAVNIFAAPGTLNFQARIKNASGVALESNNVDFVFTYRNSTNSCTLYKESYSAYDMTGSGGLVNFQFGASLANRIYPASGGTALKDIFSNENLSLTCLEGGTIPAPGSADLRYLIIQFQYAGSGGWNTLSPITLNSVPFAMYATEASKLSGLVSSDLTLKADVPNCTAPNVLTKISGVWSCAAGGGAITSSDITTALTYTPQPQNSNLTTIVGLSPLLNQVIKWNGSAWVASTDNTGTVTELDPTVAAFAKNAPSANFITTGNVLDLADTTVVAGSNFTKFNVDAKGRILSASNFNSADVTSALGYSPLSSSDTIANATNAVNATTTNQIRGFNVSATAPTINQVLQFDGSQYVPVAIPSAPVTSVSGRTGVVTLSSSDITGLGNSAGLNVGTTAGTVAAGDDGRFTDQRTPLNNSVTSAKIVDGTITSTDISAGAITFDKINQSAATTGQVIKWDGSAWVASADNTSSGTVASVTASGTLDNPIAVGGTASNPTIDLAKATNSVNGYLSSTDFTTFNNKQNALGFTPLNPSNNLSDVASSTAARTNLGLGAADSPTFTGLTLSGITGNTLLRANGSGVLANATSADVTSLLGYTPANNNAAWTLNASGDVSRASGNVGIGTATPNAKFSIAGATENSNAGAVRHYRNVIEYSENTSAVVGTIKISMPTTKLNSNTMTNTTIRGYNYGGGEWEVNVSGYNYTDGTWINTSSQIRGVSPFTTVRLASDGTRRVILLGTLATSWEYPQIVVSDFIAGYSNVSDWSAGWAAARITSEAGIVNFASMTTSQVATAAALGSYLPLAGGTLTGNLTNSARTILTGGSSTSYSMAPIEVQTTATPRIAFHWPGVVASQLGMDSSGTIRTYDNPGTGYENFAAKNITANGPFVTNGTITSTGQMDAASASGAGGYISSGNYGGTGNAAWFPSGIYSAGTNWFYGTTYTNGILQNNSSAYVINPSGDSYFNGGNFGIGTATPGAKLEVVGGVRSHGNGTRSGTSGSYSGNFFNINWTGAAAELWIDTTNVGNISLSSDHRLKHDIQDYKESGLRQIMSLRPVTYRWQNKDIYHDEGVVHRGFIADELQSVIPTAATYSKDAVDKNGKPTYQSIVVLEVLPVIVKAIQEVEAQFKDLYNKWFADSAKIHRELASIKLNKADQAEVDQLKEENKKIKNDYSEVKNRLDRLEKSLNSK